MRRTILSFFVFVLLSSVNLIIAEDLVVTSPNGKITIIINLSNSISYSVMHGKTTITLPSQISLRLQDGIVLGDKPILLDSESKNVSEILKPIVKQKFENILNEYNELRLDFKNDFSVVFRAYNDGIAYRFITNWNKDITVYSEQADFNFASDHKMYFPEEESFRSHSERLCQIIPISDITKTRFCSLPALVEITENNKCAITEADLEDYAGMYLTGNDKSSTSLSGLFPYYPAKEKALNDRDVDVIEREDYLVKTKGKRNFPWRVLVITENDSQLAESTIIYKLAKPSAKNIDFSWIKPGKVAWDWWNANNIYGVDFKSGINTATYKYYIDFASKYHIEYIILDEGWYKKGNLLEPVPEMDIPELINYGKQKNVGIILWMSWKTLDNQLIEAMDQFQKWGAVGLKVDFMQRDDAWMVNYYYRIAEEAAKRKFLVDFHGAYKPTGLYRTYPNVLTSEGVVGLEHNKWSHYANPENALTIPFIRMLAGPMDYTPGAMINGTKENFRENFNQPMSQGTRCHQLAMFIVYESPLQMLADCPSNYLKEPEAMKFLSQVPVEWDYTKVLDAKVGEYIITVRKKDSKWYVGAMTNWQPRKFIMDFSFLENNEIRNITIYQDGVNADKYGSDYKLLTKTIAKNSKLEIELAPGGGWVAIID